jgi:hypothetical protein
VRPNVVVVVTPGPERDVETAPDAGAPPVGAELPATDTSPEALAFDVFESIGTRYLFVVSEQQLATMNEEYFGGGGFPGDGIFGDFYTPGAGGGDETFVDHLIVTTAGDEPHSADFGKVQVKLVGESTGRPWTTESLPNLKIDSDEFTEGQRIGGVKHMRFNNAVVGSIFREKLTLDLYERLGYPAPRATYAWVQSSVWGPDIQVPYILVESYKPQFCKAREAQLGGECLNMWEFPGDFGAGQFAFPENCQFSECDPTSVLDFELEVVQTAMGPGYKEALSERFDWDAFHRFQCLSWILATGDDALHNSNNLVLMERADGKFQYLPYSVDISLGQSWYSTVTLGGSNSVAQGCQSDPQCWADTISTCESTIAAFIDADPVAMLNRIYADLSTREMLRPGDEGRYRELASYLGRRITELPAELELNRDGPVGGGCEPPEVLCGNYCIYYQDCFVCGPDDPGVGPAPVPVDGGVPDEPAVDELVVADQGGFGGAGNDPIVGQGGGAMAGGEGGGAMVGEAGGGNFPCLPPIETYEPNQPPIIQPPFPRPF